MTGPQPSEDTRSATGIVADVGSSLIIYSDVDAELQAPIRKMPRPGEEKAPTFDPERPEELERFFERIEDWFAEECIENDAVKKMQIVKYLDADSEAQWKALSKFLDGTFVEFKLQVIDSYPDVRKGSISVLNRKIMKIGLVAPTAREELWNLIRIMNAEVSKLERISPPIHTNRELVELFLSRLTFEFAAMVAGKLSILGLLNADNQEALQARARHPEDMYDLEEVMSMAKHIALEYINPIGQFLWTEPGKSPELNNKLTETVESLLNCVNLQAQYNEQVEAKLASLQNFLYQTTEVAPSLVQVAPMIPEVLEERADHGKSFDITDNHGHTRNCYYCGNNGHKIPECEIALRHLNLGWIIKVGNQFKMPDGSKIPRYKDMTMKSVVENLSQDRPDIYPMKRVQDQSHFFYEGFGMSSVDSDPLQDAMHAENARALSNLIEDIDIDPVTHWMTLEDIIPDDEDPWGQLFS
jgi:hypothetical protein